MRPCVNLFGIRAGDRCEYCRLPQAAAPAFTFHVEHIRARQHGGDDVPSNLALACPDCNRHKGPNLSAIDPETRAVVSLFHPLEHLWNERFAMVELGLKGSRQPDGPPQNCST